jgi:hypothetical protein
MRRHAAWLVLARHVGLRRDESVINAQKRY